MRIKNLFLFICSLSCIKFKFKRNSTLKLNRIPTFHSQKNIEHFYNQHGKVYKIRGSIDIYTYEKIISIIRMTSNLNAIKEEIGMFCTCDISTPDKDTVIIAVFMPRAAAKVNIILSPANDNLSKTLSKVATTAGMQEIDAYKRKNMIVETLIQNNIRSIKSYKEIFVERDGQYEIDINITHNGEVFNQITVNRESRITAAELHKLRPLELRKDYIGQYLELYKPNYQNLSEFKQNVEQRLKQNGHYWAYVSVKNVGFNPKTNSREIKFVIHEGPRCTVNNFDVEIDSRVPLLIRKELKSLPIVLQTKQPHPFTADKASKIVKKVREYLKDRNLNYLQMRFRGDIMEHSKAKLKQSSNPNSIDIDISVMLEIFIDEGSERVKVRTDVNETEPIPVEIDADDLKIGLAVKDGDLVSPSFIETLQENFNQGIFLNESDLKVQYQGIEKCAQSTTKLHYLTLNPSIQIGNLFGTKTLFQAKINAAKLIPPISRFIDQWTFMFPIVPLNFIQGISDELFTAECISHISPAAQFISNVNYNKNLFIPTNVYLFRDYWIKSQHLLLPYGLFELFIRPMFYGHRTNEKIPNNLIKTNLIAQTLWDMKREFLLHDFNMRFGRGFKLQYNKFDLQNPNDPKSALTSMFDNPAKSLLDLNGSAYANAIWQWPGLILTLSNEILASKMYNTPGSQDSASKMDFGAKDNFFKSIGLGWKIKGELEYQKEFEDSVLSKGNFNLRCGYMPLSNLHPLHNFQFSDVSPDYFQLGPSVDSHYIPVGGHGFFHSYCEGLFWKRILLGVGASNLWSSGLSKENKDATFNLFFSIGLKMQKRSFRVNIPLSRIFELINRFSKNKKELAKNTQMLDFTIKP